ncbi:MAG: flagellar motor switch protein FliN [Desulfobacterales bacterium]|jgi:flagellar motor switch protein FliN/FliY|nr:flagellar motor switch protein FliN [Desulfobacterales bacterium]
MVDNNKNTLETIQERTDPIEQNMMEQSLPRANTAVAQSQSEQTSQEIEFLLDVPLQVSVEVGRTRMLIKDFLKMKEGGVIELDKMADEPLDLYVNSRLIARGEAVVVNEKFGLRLIDVVSTKERLEKLR